MLTVGRELGTKNTKLSLSVDLIERETAQSLAARVAARNGVPVRDFCNDVGIKHHQLAINKPRSLEVLAALASVDRDALSRWTTNLQTKAKIVLGGHTFFRRSINYAEVRGCPSCLREQIKNDPQNPMTQMAVLGHWFLKPYTLCPKHSAPIVTLWKGRNSGHKYDFSERFGEIQDDLLSGRFDGPERDPTRFDVWLEHRLSSKATDRWIDTLLPGEAVDLCEWLGAELLLESGKPAEQTELWQKLQAGFAIVEQGKTAVTDVFNDLKSARVNKKSGPSTSLGQIYAFAHQRGSSQSRPNLTAFLRDYIVKAWPYGPGDVLFGEPVERRHLHSVHSASNEAGMDARRLRKLLSNAGLVPPAEDGPSDVNTFFEAKAGKNLLEEISNGASALDFQKQLGLSRSHFDRLRKDDLFVPTFDKASAKPLWNVDEAKTYFDAVLGKATELENEGEDWIDIPFAAQRLKIGPRLILELICADQLEYVGKVKGAKGYTDIRVKLEELKTLVTYEEASGLTVMEFAKHAKIHPQKAACLVKNGVVSSIDGVNPKTKCPQRFVGQTDIKAFAARFISPFKLRDLLGLSVTGFSKLVIASDLQPSLVASDTRGHLFEWYEVETKLYCRWPPPRKR